MKLFDFRVLVLGAAAVSCKGGAASHEGVILRGDPGAARGAEVSVAGGNVTTAFNKGRLSANATLPSFAISKHPVTIGQFRACVDAGVCGEPAFGCANRDGADEDVALCVGYENAKAFCGFTGGDLPTLSQWLLAARGSNVRRFAWGDDAPTCEHHPRAVTEDLTAALTPEGREAIQQGKQACGGDASILLRVGEHPAGASPLGLEDVLLSAGELLGTESGSVFSVCAVEARGCVVFGRTPGAIDAVERVPSEEVVTAGAAHPYGFRCVSSEESR